MKIALLGYGKMGKLIEKQALEQGYEVIARFSIQHPLLKASQISEADICIDFSRSEQVLPHLKICAEQGKNLVIGTTGWDSELDQAQHLIRESSIGCLYSPNFSIGVQLFMKIVQQAARLLNPFNQYDIGAVEYHHRHKLDHPSGTAKALTTQISEHNQQAKTLEFVSMRCGSMPGTHTIFFDSSADTITLSHQARNREGFADGALQAAHWLIGKKGFFTLNDMLNQITHS